MFLGPANIGFGHESAGADGIDGDLMWSPINCRRSCKLYDRPFAGFVMTAVDLSAGNHAVNRRDINYAPARASFDHGTTDHLRTDKCTGEVQVN